MDTLKEVGRQAARNHRWLSGTPLAMIDAGADAVALAVLNHAIAFVKARGDVENAVVAPGMWFAAGYMRYELLPSVSSPTAQEPGEAGPAVTPDPNCLFSDGVCTTCEKTPHQVCDFMEPEPKGRAVPLAPTPPETDVTIALNALLNEIAIDLHGNPDAALDAKYALYTSALVKAAVSSPSPGAVDPFEQTVADEQFMERVAKGMPEFKRDELTFRERQLGRALIKALRAPGAVETPNVDSLLAFTRWALDGYITDENHIGDLDGYNLEQKALALGLLRDCGGGYAPAIWLKISDDAGK